LKSLYGKEDVSGMKRAGEACKGSDKETNGFNKEGARNSADDCCPTTMQCTNEGCLNTRITQCQDYTNDNDCSKDWANVWRNKPPYVDTSVCSETKYEQRCKWTPESDAKRRSPATPVPAGQNGICEYGVRQLSQDAPSGSWGTEKAACLYTYVPQEACGEDNYQTVTIVATQTGNFNQLSCSEPVNNCKGRIERVPCGQPAVELPFFGASQFLGALVSIALLYVVMFQFRSIRRFFVRRK
jgi:hypothetical protein